MDRLKEKPVRTLGVILKRRWRIAAQAQRVLRHDRSNRFRTTEQPVAGGPGPAPPLVSGSKRSGEKRICRDEMSRGARAFLSSSLKTVEKSEIVFGLIDSVGWVTRGGPTEPCIGRCFGSSREFGEVGQRTFGSSKGFKTIERRNAWPRLVEIKAGIREANSLLSCASH